MTRHNKKGRNKGDGAYVAIPHFVIESAAYRALDAHARAAMVEFHHRYRGSNNGFIGMSIRSLAASVDVRAAKAQDILAQLQNKGFIRLERKSTFDWKTNIEGGGRAAEWRLTLYARDPNGEPATREFLKWSPDTPDVVPVRAKKGRAKKAETSNETVSPGEHLLQNAVLPGEQPVSPGEQPVLPGEQLGGELYRQANSSGKNGSSSRRQVSSEVFAWQHTYSYQVHADECLGDLSFEAPERSAPPESAVASSGATLRHVTDCLPSILRSSRSLSKGSKRRRATSQKKRPAPSRRKPPSANRRRSETQAGIPKSEKERAPTHSGQTLERNRGEAEAKAAASGTNRGTVEKMDKEKTHD